MKKLILVFPLCFLAVFTFAQLHWKDISDTRMPRKILPDGDKIWFCGRGGLTCINKLTEDTVYYNHANSAIPFTRIIDMCLDHSGRLWIVSDSRGIACLEGENWSWYHTGNTPLPMILPYQLQSIHKTIFGLVSNTSWLSMMVPAGSRFRWNQ
ncbi:MAG: hypothetical protein IPH84_02535 [Bacteroidales bacterium]|nr:hypothetical protein [Bacteroidales bacterium]